MNCCPTNVATKDGLWMEGEALAQLERVARMEHVVATFGMPDLHPGKAAPIGSCILTEGGFYPHFAGTDIGCGMSVWRLDPKVQRKLHKIELKDWHKSSFDVDSLPTLPSESSAFSHQIGTIGSGNHFVEFLRLEELAPQDPPLTFGLNPSDTLLLIHSGSRGFGAQVAHWWSTRHQGQFAPLDDPDTQQWLWLHNQAVEFAKLNRLAIAQRLFDLVSQPQEEAQLLLEAEHNIIEIAHPTLCQTIGRADNSHLFSHRKGATSSLHPLAVVPSARGKPSYLVAPNAQNLQFGSAIAHGAGRKWRRSDCKERLVKFSLQDLLRQGKYRALVEDKDLIYEEAPQAYKPIEDVVQTLVDLNMVKVVAKLQPLLTIKA